MKSQACEHVKGAKEKVKPRTRGCEECEKTGSSWVHLCKCLTCGHVGCCDSSANKHAAKHFQSTAHAIMQSFEHGESWKWCYIDRMYVK